MSTDLVKVGNLDIAGYQAFDENINDMALILPYLKVGQKDEIAGKLVDNSGVEVDLSSCCIVKISTARVMWAKPFKPDVVNPLCKSFDGIKPDLNLFLTGKAEGRPPAETCAKCRYSVNQDTNGEWRRSECDLQIILWGVNAKDETPFVLTLGGMSLGTKSPQKGFLTIKQFISDIKMRRQPMFLFDIGISVGKSKNAQGSAYVALIKKNGTFTQERLEQIAGLIRDMASRDSADLEKASDPTNFDEYHNE
jgi:hypothetical protein